MTSNPIKRDAKYLVLTLKPLRHPHLQKLLGDDKYRELVLLGYTDEKIQTLDSTSLKRPADGGLGAPLNKMPRYY